MNENDLHLSEKDSDNAIPAVGTLVGNLGIHQSCIPCDGTGSIG